MARALLVQHQATHLRESRAVDAGKVRDDDPDVHGPRQWRSKRMLCRASEVSERLNAARWLYASAAEHRSESGERRVVTDKDGGAKQPFHSREVFARISVARHWRHTQF